MVSEHVTYRTSVGAEVDLHNGGVFFVKYFYFEAVITGNEIKVYKCVVDSISNLTVKERVIGSSGFMAETDKNGVFNVDLLSAYNSSFAVRSCVIFDDESMIIFNFDDNSSKIFLKL